MTSPAARYHVLNYRSNKAVGKRQAWNKAPHPRLLVKKPRVSPRRGGAVSVTNRAPSARTDGQSTRMSVYAYRTHTKIEAPKSQEAEHRLILSVANQVQSELQSFTLNFMIAESDVTSCSDMCRDVLSQLEKNEEDIDNASELFYLLDSKLIDPKLKESKQFKILKLLCKKHKLFADLIPRCRDKLRDCVTNHLAKYCLSFIEEADGIYIKTINDYEDKIVEMKRSLESYFQQFSDGCDEYTHQCVAFIQNCLQNSNTVETCMKSLLDVAIHACDTINVWVKADKVYPAKLWDDILSSNTNRGKIIDKNKKLLQRREEQAQVIKRKELQRDKLHQKLSEARQEKKKHRLHKENLHERQQQTEEELDTNSEELREVQYLLDNRKSNSPKYWDRLCDKKVLLEQQLSRVEERLEMLQRQEGRYRRVDEQLDEEIYELQVETDSQNDHINELRSKLHQVEQELANNKHILQMKEDTISTAKNIRQLKLAPQTLRKIYFQKLDSHSKDLLHEACKNVSVDIGRDWEALYSDLKFFPTRSKDKRLKDIEVIKLHSVHRDNTMRMLAFLSLQKWRIFNRHASIEELIKSLRRIEKFALAHRIEHRFMKSATAKT